MPGKINGIPILEVCVDSLEGLRTATLGGAQRVELCSALEIGGVTPSHAAITNAVADKLPVSVLIRPRGGDFCYTPAEIHTMIEDVHVAAASGIDGVVIGALDEDNNLDCTVLQKLVDAAGNDITLTLHRAFDHAKDHGVALEQGIDLGFQRILTSGEPRGVDAGLGVLESLCEQASGRISIMPGGGVRLRNLATILERLPITEIHASCQTKIILRGLDTVFQGSRRETDLETVRSFVEILQRHDDR